MTTSQQSYQTLSQSEFRRQFTSVQKRLFFNHAAVSPIPRAAIERIRHFTQLRQEGSPDYWPQVVEMLGNVRRNYAHLVGSIPQRIALVTSTTHGINLLAAGLDWHPGDRILITRGEFPANVLPFRNLAYRGVEVDFLEIPDLAVTPEILEQALTPRTRLFSISAVQFLTGFKADLKALAQVCHQYDVLFAVDGIQGVGVYPFNVEAWGVDFLACGGHKWLFSPLGAGFVYLTEELQSRLHPVFTGLQGLEDPQNFLAYDQPLAESARRFETGAYNALALAGSESSTKLLLASGLESIQKHINALVDYFQELLTETSFAPCYSFPPEHRAGIFYFTHAEKPELNPQVHQYLMEKGVVLSLRGGNLRLSPHYWNTRDEIERLIELLSGFDA